MSHNIARVRCHAVAIVMYSANQSESRRIVLSRYIMLVAVR